MLITPGSNKGLKLSIERIGVKKDCKWWTWKLKAWVLEIQN